MSLAYGTALDTVLCSYVYALSGKRKIKLNATLFYCTVV